MSEISKLKASLKARPISELRKFVDKEDAVLGFNGFGGADRLKLEDGKLMKVRLFPARPEDENFFMAKTSYWLTMEGESGSYRGTVLDARKHGGFKKDLVDEYVKLAKRMYSNDLEKIAPMTATGMNSENLLPTNSWVAYAGFVINDEMCKAQIWEFKKMVRDQLNKLAFTEDSEEPMEVDPFSDWETGLPFLIKYNKNPNKKKGEDYYEVSLPRNPKPYTLSDDELEYFMNLKPLTEVVGKSTIKDFERALGGLQYFDEKHDLGLFEEQEWLDIVEEVRGQYNSQEWNEITSGTKDTNKKTKKQQKKVEPEPEIDDEAEDEAEVEDEDSGDEFDKMDRTALKAYIKSNNIEFTVYKSTSDYEIREAIRNASNDVDEPEDIEEQEDDEDELPFKDEKPAAPPKASGGRLTLAEIQARLKSKE